MKARNILLQSRDALAMVFAPRTGSICGFKGDSYVVVRSWPIGRATREDGCSPEKCRPGRVAGVHIVPMENHYSDRVVWYEVEFSRVAGVLESKRRLFHRNDGVRRDAFRKPYVRANHCMMPNDRLS